MTTIVIKDLAENVELDRQAMTAITGGSRARNRQTFLANTTSRDTRIVYYPAGFNLQRWQSTRDMQRK